MNVEKIFVEVYYYSDFELAVEKKKLGEWNFHNQERESMDIIWQVCLHYTHPKCPILIREYHNYTFTFPCSHSHQTH